METETVELVHTYCVGELYKPERTSWPEGNHFDIRNGKLDFVVFWEGLGDETVKAVRKGRLRIGLLVRQPMIFFLFEIEGACNWSDAPYSYHLTEPTERQLPQRPQAGSGLLLNTTLVECETGIIRALRVDSLSHELSTQLVDAAATQAKAPIDRAEYDLALNSLYRRYPNTQAMLEDATIFEVAGVDATMHPTQKPGDIA